MEKKTGHAGTTPTARRRSNAPSGGSNARRSAAAPRRGTSSARRRGRSRRAGGIEGLILKLSTLTSSPKGLVKLGGFFLALILVIVVVGSLASRPPRPDVAREPEVAASATDEAPEDGAEAVEGEGGDAEPDGEAEPEGEAKASAVSVMDEIANLKSRPDEKWQDGLFVPEPQGDGYLPVFRHAEREDKVIAITVDDCFQTENLRQIIQLAEDVDGKLTIFPIGELMQREKLQEVLRYAHDIGFEIENHTWSHDTLYGFTNEQLAAHIFNQDRALDYVLGVNYYTHFLRPKGGDDRNDLRTHSYINQLGYYGIAHWSVTGSSSNGVIAQGLVPGAVFLFHCTDTDLAKLQGFIPYATEQGYKLVTLNELFGYAKNYEEPLTDDPKTRTIPQLEPYERDYKTIKVTTYDYAAYEVQQALISKGYMKGSPDGIYGKGTAKSAAAWQKDSGYAADGVLTPEQQRRLLGVE